MGELFAMFQYLPCYFRLKTGCPLLLLVGQACGKYIYEKLRLCESSLYGNIIKEVSCINLTAI